MRFIIILLVAVVGSLMNTYVFEGDVWIYLWGFVVAEVLELILRLYDDKVKK